MFETLKRLWVEGKLTSEMLKRAEEKGWITEYQCNEIKENAE